MIKYVLMISIVAVFGWVGYSRKKHFIDAKSYVVFIKEYVQFYNANLLVFKNDLEKINNEYIIMQNNKTANNINFSLKNHKIEQFEQEFIKSELKKLNENTLIFNYFESIGAGEYEDELNKNEAILKVLNHLENQLTVDIKQKGELGLKLMLAIGAVVAVVIW